MLDKTDLIRLLDVLLIGPLMIKGSRNLTGPAKMILWASGWGTILYNGYNLYQSKVALMQPEKSINVRL